MSKVLTPIRTCVSCGAKRPKKELIRLALGPGGIVARDDRGGVHGRGAYVCPKKSCWEDLRGSGKLRRAFRKEEPVKLRPGLERYDFNKTE